MLHEPGLERFIVQHERIRIPPKSGTSDGIRLQQTRIQRGEVVNRCDSLLRSVYARAGPADSMAIVQPDRAALLFSSHETEDDIRFILPSGSEIEHDGFVIAAIRLQHDSPIRDALRKLR